MKKKTTIIKTIAIISTVLVVAGCSTVPDNEESEGLKLNEINGLNTLNL